MTIARHTVGQQQAAPAAPAPGQASDQAPEPFLPLRALRSQAALWLGMAALLAWVDLLFCFEGVLRDNVVEAGGLVHDPVFLGATLAAGLALMAAGLARTASHPSVSRPSAPQHPSVQRPSAPQHPRLHHLTSAENRPTIYTAGALGAIGTLTAIALTVFSPGVSAVLTYALGITLGLAIAWATLAWGEVLARVDLREALLSVSVASCLQWIPLLVACAAPTAARTAFGVVLPLVWCVCLRVSCAGSSAVASPGAIPGTAVPSAGCSGGTARATQPDRDLPRMTVTMLLFGAVIQFSWSFFVKMLPGRLDVRLFPLVFALVVAVFAVTVGLCTRIMNRQRSYRLELYYRATMLFCLCGVAATSASAVAGGSGDASAGLLASYTLVYVGYSFVCPTMWLLSLGYASLRLERPRRVVGLVLGGQYLGFFLGALGVDAMKAAGLADLGPQLAPIATLALVALLAVAYVAVFPERNLLSLSPLLFGMSHESLGRRCAQIARERGLTPREAEILALLARGRDTEYVSDALDIARNTVNAHRKSIYTKLGVHSQQELLSVVEQAQG